MNSNYFKLIFILPLLFTLGEVMAQNIELEVRGTVLDSESMTPVEYATITMNRVDGHNAIGGTTSDLDGNFSFLSDQSDVYFEVSFIGFETQQIEEFEIVNGLIDLGSIRLDVNAENLDEILIRADKSTTEFKLDKRVFNVGRDLSNSGASLLDVLNNVPSVNVSIEGEISLRGSSGVQILINGKPSVLANEEGNALGSITAEMIEKIEVITNPSAKYDAEGTSGIINIVIKKEEKKGINGSLTLNSGFPNNHSLGFSMNRRTEKFNLFTQMGIGYRTFPGSFETINKDLLLNTEISTTGERDKNEAFYNLILGTDYHINKYNVITLSGNYALEKESEFSDANYTYGGADSEILSSWNRNESTAALNPKWQYELQYKKDFKNHKDHDLLFSALGHFFGKDKSSDFVNSFSTGTLGVEEQKIRTDFSDADYTFKLDYTFPFLDKYTLEAGAQYLISDVANDYEVADLINGEWFIDDNLTNVFNYNQKVLGVYGTAAYEGKAWGLKAGLRMEKTDLQTYLENTGKNNDQNYTKLFPSVHTSYKITENFSLQAGYSKRIFRPRMWDLNPFFNLTNSYSIRTGNPELRPEFSDSYELNTIYILGKSSFNLGIYQRYTTDVIERVISFEDNVSTTIPMNVGTNRATGIEFNTKYSPFNWLTLTGDVNYNYFNRVGSFELSTFDFKSDQWSGKLTSKLKFPAGHEVEISGRYRSSYQTVQSTVSGDLYFDFGFRKKLMKGRTIINLSVRDVFASRNREYESIQDNYYIYSSYNRGRYVSFGISYGFGKGEAMEFSGQKRRF